MKGRKRKSSISAQVHSTCFHSRHVSDLVIGQRGAEMVCVEVPPSLHVCDADGLTTLDGHAALTRTLGLPTNLPVAIGIFSILHPCYRLLSTAYTQTPQEFTPHNCHILESLDVDKRSSMDDGLRARGEPAY